MIAFTPTPTNQHLTQLRDWLEEEKQVTGWSFICNWSVIQRSFECEELYCAVENDHAIAFTACTRLTDLARIEVACVRHDQRRRGLGNQLTGHVLRTLKSRHAVVVELDCKPPESEVFWRRVGFHEPDGVVGSRDLGQPTCSPVQLIKYLTERLAPVTRASSSNYIELWNTQFPEGPPTWAWELPAADDGFLSLPVPIVQACERDWRIKLVVDDARLYEGKVKRLMDGGATARDGYLHLDKFWLEDVGA